MHWFIWSNKSATKSLQRWYIGIKKEENPIDISCPDPTECSCPEQVECESIEYNEISCHEQDLAVKVGISMVTGSNFWY